MALSKPGTLPEETLAALSREMRRPRDRTRRRLIGALECLVRVTPAAAESLAVLYPSRPPDERKAILGHAYVSGGQRNWILPLLRAAMADSVVDQRILVIQQTRSIGALGGPPFVDLLVSAMDDESAEVRIAAVEQIQRMGRPAAAALPVLARLAREDPHEAVRERAVQAMARIRP